MHLSGSHHLPRSFPIGSTYVVEGRGGGEGDLRVFSRYVVLPGGKRINISDFAGDFDGPASPRVRTSGRARNRTRRAAPDGKPRSARTKK
jgi:hypothetical protein